MMRAGARVAAGAVALTAIGAMIPASGGTVFAQAAFAQAPSDRPAARRAAAALDAGPRVVRADGALLRGLDKISGVTTDLPLAVGDSVDFGRLTVRLGECREPADDPDSDAFAQMTITNRKTGTTPFSGWMIASSPALSALDDARYDIWVVTCNDGTNPAQPELVYEPDTEPQPEDAGEGGPAPEEFAADGGGDTDLEPGDDPDADTGADPDADTGVGPGPDGEPPAD